LFLSSKGAGTGIIARKGTDYFGHLRRQVEHTKRKEADSMNINILEKATRMVLKGENVDSRPMLKNGVITPAEHRSLESLSAQIAANMHSINIGTGSGVMALKVKPQPRTWA
jgi:hypothetical protein